MRIKKKKTKKRNKEEEEEAKMEKRGRDVWLHDETKTLLNILKPKQIADLMDTKKFRTVDIFKSLEKDLQHHKIQRTAKQIQIKYKSLKQSFNNTRRVLSQSGAGASVKCPYFEELQEIFGHRPICIQEGIDSITIDPGMYDNLPDPLDGAMPGTSSSSMVSEYSETFASKDLATDPETEAELNNVNKNDKGTTVKVQKDKKKCTLQSKKRETFAQTFDKAVDKIINSNIEQTKMLVENTNKTMMAMIENEKKLIEEQTQLFLQLFNSRSTSTMPPSQSRRPICLERINESSRPLISNSSPRFVKLPLSVVETARTCVSPRFITPPPTPTSFALSPSNVTKLKTIYKKVETDNVKND